LKRHVEGVHSSKDAKDFDLKSEDRKSEDRSNSPIGEPEDHFPEKSQNSFDSVKNALLAAITPPSGGNSESMKIENELSSPPEIPLDTDGQTYTCDRCLLR